MDVSIRLGNKKSPILQQSLTYYRTSFLRYLEGKYNYIAEYDSYIGLARIYPEDFVVWRTFMLLTTGVDPVIELEGYPLRWIDYQNQTTATNKETER
jgi:hypothetical protein